MTQFLKDWMSFISSDLYEEILKPKSLNQKQFLKDFLLNSCSNNFKMECHVA